VALVVDPVLRASTGASFADDALLRAYRDELLPRATAVTPNRREAERLAGGGCPSEQAQALGVPTVCITGGDDAGALAVDWLLSPQASGWLALPRREARNHHGTGCCFATALAAALARGFVPADAAVLAKMLTTSGLSNGASPGAGAGPVRPTAGFINDAGLLPALFDSPPSAWPAGSDGLPVEGVYGITDSGAHAAELFDAGLATVQLRLKRADGESGVAWHARLAAEVQPAREAARRHGATFIVNDHWRAALALGVDFVHLGQEDLLALDATERAGLAQARARGLRLGVSSHSLWELARCVAWRPDYIACGPVWPTLTKAMPWRPQGLDNLAWWATMSPVPVVGIGGVLAPEQLIQIATCGASAGCVVRGLTQRPVGEWLDAWRSGTGMPLAVEAGWPHPSLGGPGAVQPSPKPR
jgi:hydroxymethylpyrimidine kinase/phosphomethylpyrimidine kinase/thiamine-phosphate diphosphorylase